MLETGRFYDMKVKSKCAFMQIYFNVHFKQTHRLCNTFFFLGERGVFNEIYYVNVIKNIKQFSEINRNVFLFLSFNNRLMQITLSISLLVDFSCKPNSTFFVLNTLLNKWFADIVFKASTIFVLCNILYSSTVGRAQCSGTDVWNIQTMDVRGIIVSTRDVFSIFLFITGNKN